MSLVNVFVVSKNASSERRFDRTISIRELKSRLEPITGIPASSQGLVLTTAVGASPIATLDNDDATLDSYPVANLLTLHVTDTSPFATAHDFTDDSKVEKYEMPTEEYESRQDTVLAYKKRNKIGRFADDAGVTATPAQTFEEEAKHISVGQRCEVDFGALPGANPTEESLKKRGVVQFVGETSFGKGGWWIGVAYDEPVGKHDGQVDGKRYFTCPNKHGAFVRPNKVKAGDFPEEDPFDELEEM